MARSPTGKTSRPAYAKKAVASTVQVVKELTGQTPRELLGDEIWPVTTTYGTHELLRSYVKHVSQHFNGDQDKTFDEVVYSLNHKTYHEVGDSMEEAHHALTGTMIREVQAEFLADPPKVRT